MTDTVGVNKVDLSRGAQRCLRLIRLFGGVSLPQWRIAKKLRCSVRTVKRYIRELRDSGRIRVTRRGPIEATYTLSNERTPKKNVPSFVPSLLARHPKQTNLAGAHPFPQAEANAIEGHVRACGLEPTPQLLARLALQSQFYGVNGFRIAAAIERARRRVDGTSNMPRGLGWVIKVVENELKPQTVQSSCTEQAASRNETEPLYSHLPQMASNWQEKIADLARAKKM